MHPNRRHILRQGAVLAAAAMAGTRLAAQGYPDRPVHIVVPFTAGGVGDTVARLVADRLTQRLGQRFIVDNKPGAGGSIGTEFVARAPADGHTLLLASPGFTVNPALQRDLKWDPVTDFAPVAMLATIPNVIVVGASQPYATLAQLMEDARQRPGQLTFASAGIGSSPHLAGELLNVSGRVRMVHVPYKGQSDAVADLMTGRVTFMALTSALALPQIQGGKLRALAVTSSRRAATLQQVPTVAESGVAGYEVDGWLALLAPARTDPRVVGALHAAVRQVLAEAPLQTALAALNCEVSPPDTPADLGRFVRDDREKWAQTIRTAGIRNN